MKSMTGYGRGESSQKGYKVTVEVSSVNRKQAEIAVNLPRELEVLEAQVRDEINRRVSRGRISVRISVHAASGQIRVDLDTARAYKEEFSRLLKELKLPESITLDLLLRQPGVVHTSNDFGEAEEVWPGIEKALRQSLDAMVKMREREGAHLERDLTRRMKTIRKSVTQVEKQAPRVAERFRNQLQERIKNAGLEMPALDDDRLIKEVVYFADRSDIAEEISRLQSHFAQYDDCLGSKEPVGRTLDFLSQEMNREINTLAAKANDSLISKEIVVLKTELERFREQAQNVE